MMTRAKKFIAVLALFLVAVVAMIGAIPYLSVYAASGTITLTAYSYFKEGDGLGHSWISVKNDTNKTYSLGVYTMEPGETVTVGIWGNLGDKGVWYNVESYGIDEFELFDGHVSISETITEEELTIVSDYIYQNDRWDIIYNCSFFAEDLWNKVSDKKLDCGTLIHLPKNLYNSIKNIEGRRFDKDIPTNSKIGYVKNNEFYEEVPEELDGSTSSSSAAYNLPEVQSSFPETDLEKVITAQLDYIGSDFTYAEYLQRYNLAT